ncbi:MAG: hypothetical protein ACQEWU_08650 [Bacillota bacterium]|uniref:RNA polymerase subunit sigma-70 n=1 Tax=Virgibacillus salarius TaxID=447199 RepID=A0A941DVH6_9BACI|nr:MULTISPECIES: hypothetical protein [Bacillaceae]NAZ10235.1 hypothetical protein [Agaribacter marinus]MBR7797525.1 hypothetical protein [Virgibacillus salarius]MCC2250270.1 hypothetical protein [Virgibacillus sp. AGTR]MDY7044635.1 hypothetical protein [Virgibacillus sp. M23]QRZ20299.1 hypothetical protein JUJ52_17440 [Virgibacillus sp. AGTR]
MMRSADKQWHSHHQNEVFGVNLHKFMEMEGHANHMEIAQELGISLGEVKMLKKKITRA